MAKSVVESWVEDILWNGWGWKRWMEDDCDLAFRDTAEKRRIQSAVEFIIRALGNNKSAETEAIVAAIVERRNG